MTMLGNPVSDKPKFKFNMNFRKSARWWSYRPNDSIHF